MGGLLHLVQREGTWAAPWSLLAVPKGVGGLRPTQAPPRCTKYNSSPINGQCTNLILFDVALTASGL